HLEGASIAEGSVIRPNAVIVGPVSIGSDCVVHEQSILRGPLALGPVCKVGGEVQGCIFQAFANKGHAGFLGDSYVGEWANLGAGTDNSNLLNTYSHIAARALPEREPEPTGERFLGAMIGDHSKIGIGSRLMTGAVIHLGCMFATADPITGCVPPFTWHSDAGRSLHRFDKFLETAGNVMTRRDVEPSAAYIERLRSLHADAESLHDRLANRSSPIATTT
ncbi:MAG: hypothetical protein AAF747_10205, partial [Planctomycetota bacterium]